MIEHVLDRERERTYLAALRRLNRCQRRYLALRIEGGQSFGEIAARTGSSEDGAHACVARAIRAITDYVLATAAWGAPFLPRLRVCGTTTPSAHKSCLVGGERYVLTCHRYIQKLGQSVLLGKVYSEDSCHRLQRVAVS